MVRRRPRPRRDETESRRRTYSTLSLLNTLLESCDLGPALLEAVVSSVSALRRLVELLLELFDLLLSLGEGSFGLLELEAASFVGARTSRSVGGRSGSRSVGSRLEIGNFGRKLSLGSFERIDAGLGIGGGLLRVALQRAKASLSIGGALLRGSQGCLKLGDRIGRSLAIGLTAVTNVEHARVREHPPMNVCRRVCMYVCMCVCSFCRRGSTYRSSETRS